MTMLTTYGKVTLATMDYEIIKHPPYSPDLAPSDWTNECAPRKTEISNWWWAQMWCPELATQLLALVTCKDNENNVFV
jgi:hypothetical protein